MSITNFYSYDEFVHHRKFSNIFISKILNEKNVVNYEVCVNEAINNKLIL